MRIKADCTIDLDSNRRVWISTVADDVDPDEAAAAADALCTAAADGAMKAYDHARENDPALGASADGKGSSMAAMQGG